MRRDRDIHFEWSGMAGLKTLIGRVRGMLMYIPRVSMLGVVWG